MELTAEGVKAWALKFFPAMPEYIRCAKDLSIKGLMLRNLHGHWSVVNIEKCNGEYIKVTAKTGYVVPI